MHTVLRAAAAGDVLGDAGMTVLIGLLVVFAALIVLTLIFMLFGRAVYREKKAPSVSENRPAPKPAPAPAAAPSPIVEQGVSEEVVAAIAAAIAAMAPEGKRYAIRRVSRARGERPVWATAGLLEQTRPF